MCFGVGDYDHIFMFSSPNILNKFCLIKRRDIKIVTSDTFSARDRSVDGRIILRWIFRKQDVGIWTGGGHL
jgi:hypothetical protein